MLYFGTHNSGTAGPLVWWQWIFTWIFQLVSQCQDLTIKEQLDSGVKVFNFQVTYYKGEWHFSHGLCIYKEKLSDAINLLHEYATEDNPIYFQLYLDKNFFLGQNKEEFEFYVLSELQHICGKDKPIKMLNAWIEGTNTYPYKSGLKINLVEKYWTKTWGDNYGESWIDKLPLPKRHAKKYNSTYKKEYKEKAKYLMLDFFELGKW